MTSQVFPQTTLERLNEASAAAVEACAVLARDLPFSPFELGMEMCQDQEQVQAITEDLVRCFVSQSWQVYRPSPKSLLLA